MGNELLVKGGEGSLGKASVAGQPRVAGERRRHGQEEPQRRAGLAAVQKRTAPGPGPARLVSRDWDDAKAQPRARDLGAKGAQALRGGVDVLGGGVAVYVAGLGRERGADEEAVRLGLGGRRLDGALEAGRRDGDVQALLLSAAAELHDARELVKGDPSHDDVLGAARDDHVHGVAVALLVVRHV